MRFTLAFILIFIAFASSAQRPAHYFFGQDHFKGIDIYDLIQDQDNNYWFATGSGLYKYDGYSYENVECEEMKGASVFGFCSDSKGNIYCHNLHHQIFRIKDGKMSVYYELPEIERKPDILIVVDKQDNLIIQSARITIIKPDKKEIKTAGDDESISKYGSLSSLVVTPEGGTIGNSIFPMIVRQNDGILKYHDCRETLGIKDFDIVTRISWILFDGKVLAIDTEHFKVYEFDFNKNELVFIKQLEFGPTKHFVRLYVAKNELWVLGTSNGAHVYNTDLEPLFNGRSIFKNHFISDIFTDHEDNVLLSTFDEGVIVVPSNAVLGSELPNHEKISKIEPFNNSILVGSNTGSVYSYSVQDGLSLLNSDENKRGIETIHFWPERNTIVHTVIAGIQLIDLRTKIKTELRLGSFKDVHFINKNKAIISLNKGLIDVKYNKNGTLKTSIVYKGRTYTVSYDKNTESYFTGTSDGLKIITAKGEISTIAYKGNTVFANAITYFDGKVYVGTRKHGILVFSNDKIVRQIPFNETVRKLSIHDNKLYILSRFGLYIGRLNGNNFSPINKSSGFNCDNIRDFCISNKILYITNSATIQHIALVNLFVSNQAVPIHLSSILVNGKQRTTAHYSHDQSNIRFEFKAKTLLYQDNLYYEYKLIGTDDGWKRLPYDNNFVEFNALAPGKYTFLVRTVNGNKRSKTIKYSFSIDAPFYQKWWFYLIIVLISCLIIGGVYSIRIRQIRKKNKERLEKQRIQTDLFETELKALRSQMNPHFIFNSLNSIQDLILKEDTDASYDYIVLFADLVRSALNYSNKDFIPIDKEMEFLDVYLSLEKLRFKEDFEYTLENNGIDEINVPSMLIQPFIENALLHGLLHKEGRKTLSIKFEFHSKDQLICVIEDNGIGRKKANEIRQRQGANHDSFALDAINKRLAIFNEQQGETTGKFVIEDVHPELEDSGTKVTIHLPFRRQY